MRESSYNRKMSYCRLPSCERKPRKTSGIRRGKTMGMTRKKIRRKKTKSKMLTRMMDVRQYSCLKLRKRLHIGRKPHEVEH